MKEYDWLDLRAVVKSLPYLSDNFNKTDTNNLQWKCRICKVGNMHEFKETNGGQVVMMSCDTDGCPNNVDKEWKGPHNAATFNDSFDSRYAFMKFQPRRVC